MTCKKSSDNPVRRVFGRRQSRPLRKSQAEAFNTLLPVLCVPDDALSIDGRLTVTSLFKSLFTEYQLEIGFGSGEHLSTLLQKYPKIGFIGAEPFINGMATFLRDIKDKPHDNIRVHMDDALTLVHALCNTCIDKIYILNPDPWPKKRHHKRRIINQENLNQFVRILKHGGELIIATDVDDLAEWMVTQCSIHPELEWIAMSANDWKTPPKEWIETRYAFKGRSEGRNQTFLIFKKTLAN
ncbi:MAG: tRNA (guanosine(46)-N7)-methyltransferase TrmB [Alphaproteobacteria bacterium]|nr:tRNA (guanosine(46)-N7)-methyltransferase TrmB [Alphaproteobacteria bacterium]